MKTTFLLIALLPFFICSAQERSIKKDIIPTAYGSFGTMKMESQTEGKTASAGEAQFTHSSVKTSDGGTATFINFNTKSTPEKPGSQKTIPNVASVSVYPNPTNGQMTIKYFIPKNEEAEFAIYDMAGKKLSAYRLTGENNQLTISESDLHAGIYFYNVISNGQIVKQDKIVVIK